MSTYTNVINGAPTTDADFRLFCQAVEAALVASGILVQVAANTGQMNLTTVTIPTTGAFGGSRMYKFVDATKGQFYMRVDYGIGSASGRPCCRIQYGNSTDGAVTLTGAVTNQFTVTNNNTGTASDFIAGGGGAFGGLVLMRIGASGLCFFGMTRLVADDGTISSQGVMGVFCGNGVAAGGARGDATSWTPATLVSANLTGVFPLLSNVFHSLGTPTKAPAMRGFISLAGEVLELPILSVRHSEAVLSNAGSAFLATWRGAPHTFIPVSPTGVNGLDATSNLAMLFE